MGVEHTTCTSRVQRPNHYTTESLWSTHITLYDCIAATMMKKTFIHKTLENSHEVLAMIIRDHSFLRNAEFYVKPWNLPVSTEFLHFLGIWYWQVIRGQIRNILVRFRRL